MSTEVQPYNYPASTLDQFDRLGHPGKFHRVIPCGTGVTTFTGSNFGVGGIVVPPGTTGTASFSLGGDLPLSLLSSGSVRAYEFSLRSVKVDSGTVYALIRNQVAK
jgi:hypothetical protein